MVKRYDFAGLTIAEDIDYSAFVNLEPNIAAGTTRAELLNVESQN
jgi:hypothetical protein